MHRRVVAAAVLLAVLAACMPAAEAADLRALLQTPKAIVPGKNCDRNKKPRGTPSIRRVSPPASADTAFWSWRIPKPLPKNGRSGCILGLEYSIVKIIRGTRTTPPPNAGTEVDWTPVSDLNAPELITFPNPEADKTRYRIYTRWVGDNGFLGNPSSNTATLLPPGGGT